MAYRDGLLIITFGQFYFRALTLSKAGGTYT